MLLGAFFNIYCDMSVGEREGNVLAPFGKAHAVSVEIIIKSDIPTISDLKTELSNDYPVWVQWYPEL